MSRERVQVVKEIGGFPGFRARKAKLGESCLAKGRSEFCTEARKLEKSVTLPYSAAGKESACNVGDPCSIRGLGRSAREGIGYSLQCSWACLVAQTVKNPPAMWDIWVGKIPWRRERLPTPVFWPGEFHGPYSPWCRKESDTTEPLSPSSYFFPL